MLALRRWTNETSNQFILQVNGLVSCPERSQGQSIAHKAPAAWLCCLLLLRWKPQIFRYFLFDCLALILLVQVLLNAAVEKKRAPPFFNFVFSSLLLCDVPWWCYTIVVWTQDNSWCYLVYFVGVALWCLHKNPFSGYFLVFIWIKKYDVLCTIHTMILCMGGYSSVKRPNDVFLQKNFYDYHYILV